MSDYHLLRRRLERLERKRIITPDVGYAHAEEITRLQHLLDSRKWPEISQSIYQHFIDWHAQEIAEGRPYGKSVTSLEGQQARKRLDARFDTMLSRLPKEELAALRVAVEQEVVTRDGDE